MYEEYDDPYEEDDVEVSQKTNQYHDSHENQKSSRRGGNSRRDKQRQKKHSKDRNDHYEDRWN